MTTQEADLNNILESVLEEQFSNTVVEDCSDNSDVEVIEWGADYHTEYNKLPSKTQKMMTLV